MYCIGSHEFLLISHMPILLYHTLLFLAYSGSPVFEAVAGPRIEWENQDWWCISNNQVIPKGMNSMLGCIESRFIGQDESLLKEFIRKESVNYLGRFVFQQSIFWFEAFVFEVWDDTFKVIEYHFNFSVWH